MWLQQAGKGQKLSFSRSNMILNVIFESSCFSIFETFWNFYFKIWRFWFFYFKIWRVSIIQIQIQVCKICTKKAKMAFLRSNVFEKVILWMQCSLEFRHFSKISGQNLTGCKNFSSKFDALYRFWPEISINMNF